MKTDKPLLSSPSNKRLTEIAASKPQTTLVVGSEAGNEENTAIYLAHQIIGNELVQVETAPAIEGVRAIQTQARSSSQEAQAVVIVNVDSMSLEAQNALLKLLEEPTENVFYVLAAKSATSVLGTIQSRSTVLTLSAPSLADATTHYKEHADEQVAAAMMASGGNVPFMEAYLQGENEYMAVAKEIIKQDAYSRVATASQYMSDREKSRELVLSMQNIFRFLATKPNTRTMALKGARNCSQTIEQLDANGNTKLLLGKLLTSF